MIKRITGFFSGKLARQVVLVVVSVQTLLTFVLVWQGVSVYSRLLHDRLVARCVSNASLLRESVLPLVMGHDLVALDNLLRRSHALPDIRSIAVVDDRGAVLAHTDPDKVGKFTIDERSEGLRMAAKTANDAPLVMTDAKTLIEVGAPLLAADRRLGWVRVIVDPSDTLKAQRAAVLGGAGIGILAVIASAIVAILAARRISRRLAAVLAAIRQYKEAGTAPPLLDASPDEVGELTRTLVQFMNEISVRRGQETADRYTLEGIVKARTHALEGLRRELEAIIDNMPALVFYKDTENRFVRVNSNMASAYDLPRQAMEGRSLDELAPAEWAKKNRDDDLRVVESKTAQLDVEEPWESPHGRRWLLTSRVPILGESGDVRRVLGISIDVTERKALEEALKRSNQELEQFAYVASHDLQEPLRMVASYTELLAERYRGKLDEKADKYIAYAVDGAKRMQGLITDLLTYSRVGTRRGPLQTIRLEAALAEALKNLEVVLRESHGEVKHAALPSVVADTTQMVQLFQNLIGNALKFRGSVPPEVTVTAMFSQGEWTIGVRDNGIGIDPQYQERIFRVFQRLHERGKYPGSGIGLAICKKIVEGHGGRIWVESRPGQGATFCFTVPDSGVIADVLTRTQENAVVAG